jgi:hypothetical protein
MKSLSKLLFEADEDLSLVGDLTGALKTSLEPIQKKVDQMGNDIKVIQAATGEKKQDPTNARATSGTTKPETPVLAKNSGTVTPSTTTPPKTDGKLEARVGELAGQVEKLISLAEARFRSRGV